MCPLWGVNDSRLLEKHHTDGRNFSPNVNYFVKIVTIKITIEQIKITPKRNQKNATPNELVKFC